ncbi:MAG: hypothetical protein A2Y76_15475 [Planctomycetes bacterium RBG_13_60_9]|nr:MAG: hypothetical protein A2Y76_15475 [Planctomycetes bacterium RBG_13_60_9]
MQDEIRKYLFDILQAAKDIVEFTRDLRYTDYVADAKTQASVERKFEIVGEALNRIKRLDKSLVATIPDHERIISFRNIISHGYDIINPELVWDAVQNHLPALVQVVQDLLRS